MDPVIDPEDCFESFSRTETANCTKRSGSSPNMEWRPPGGIALTPKACEKLFSAAVICASIQKKRFHLQKINIYFQGKSISTSVSQSSMPFRPMTFTVAISTSDSRFGSHQIIEHSVKIVLKDKFPK